MTTKVNAKKAPAAIGPYSQGVICGSLVFTSGQIALDAETGALTGENITEQTHKVCKNLGEILAQAGSSFERVVKTTCYLADMNDFAEFNKVYAEYFISKPARSCVAVKALPKGALVEVEAIAEVG
ncbi:MAG: RidA family protein [Ruminococcaceae bacterium]|nr:RidA family protein [Oscillospiraceae bacterium]